MSWVISIFTLVSCSAVLALEAGDKLTIKDQLQQGSLVKGSICSKCQVVYLGEYLSTTEDGTFVFGLSRDAPSVIYLTLLDDQNFETKYSFPVKARVYDTQRIQGVPQRTVTPSESEFNRIRKMRA